MCFAPQQCALFRRLNFKKCSEPGVLYTFWLGNVLRATTACTFSSSQLTKSAQSMVCFVHFNFDMCFAPQRRALFQHLNFQMSSERAVFLAFWLANVLRATTACNFSSLIRPDGSAPVALASLPFYLFARLHLLSSDYFSSLIFSLLLFSSLLKVLPPLLFHLSILSEVWLLNFLRLRLYIYIYYRKNTSETSWNTTWNIMEHHETSWSIVKHHETSWNFMTHHETSWNTMKHHETPNEPSWYIMKHHETSWNTKWNIMKHHEAPHETSLNFMKLHEASWNIMRHHETPWNIRTTTWNNMNIMKHHMKHHEASWNIMKHHEASWNIMKLHETSWNFMKHRETSWNFMKLHEASWNIMKHHETSWNTKWNIMKHHEAPHETSLKLHEASWNLMKHHETSWNFMKHRETSWNIMKHPQTYHFHVIFFQLFQSSPSPQPRPGTLLFSLDLCDSLIQTESCCAGPEQSSRNVLAKTGQNLWSVWTWRDNLPFLMTWYDMFKQIVHEIMSNPQRTRIKQILSAVCWGSMGSMYSMDRGPLNIA